MKLSTQAVIDVYNALVTLDGKLRVVKDGEREQVVREPYTFGPGLRVAIAKNIANLKVIADVYAKGRENLILHVTGGRPMIDGNDYEKQLTFAVANAQLMAELHEVAVVTIKEDELKLGVNPIPGTVLAAMAPIIEGESWEIMTQAVERIVAGNSDN